MTLLAGAAAALLTACGGGDDGEPQAPAEPATTSLVGKEFMQTTRLEDGTQTQRIDKVYGVTRNGTLTLDPTHPELLEGAHLFLADSHSTTAANLSMPAVVSAEAMERFWGDLRGAFSARFAEEGVAAHWARLEAYDRSPEALYRDWKQSGLSVAEFVDFYAALADARISARNDDDEGELAHFLRELGITQHQWLDALAARITTWPQFLAKMHQQGDSFAALTHLLHLERSKDDGLTPAAFIAQYLAQTKPALAAVQADNLLANFWMRDLEGKLFWDEMGLEAYENNAIWAPDVDKGADALPEYDNKFYSQNSAYLWMQYCEKSFLFCKDGGVYFMVEADVHARYMGLYNKVVTEPKSVGYWIPKVWVTTRFWGSTRRHDNHLDMSIQNIKMRMDAETARRIPSFEMKFASKVKMDNGKEKITSNAYFVVDGLKGVSFKGSYPN